ncbi:MAG: alpha/beta hydrolase family protein [Nitrososphaerales archaeon]
MPEKSYPLESLLSARMLLAPALVEDHVYFLGNMSGHISLHRMKKEGGMPEPLLPPDIALQNPHLMMGDSFVVFPALKKILVMIDNNGDENYQACTVPLEGGIPQNVFGEKYVGQQLACFTKDVKSSTVYLWHDDRKTPNIECLRVDLKSMKVTSLGTSIYGNVAAGANKSNTEVVLVDGYTAADNVLYLWREKTGKRELLFGTPIEKREAGKDYPPSGIERCNFADDGKGVIIKTTLLDDAGSIAYLPLNGSSKLEPVQVSGTKHRGKGELEDVMKLEKDRYLVRYNIDGCSFAYEGRLVRDPSKGRSRRMMLETCVVGQRPVSNGVLLGIEPWTASNAKSNPAARGYTFSFATATFPSQIYLTTIGKKVQHTMLSNEKVLGIPKECLSAGEDASYTSFDGLRISARIYFPASALGFKPPFPLVLYVHGGPQGQERPDFTWFSMPLIQYLTLNGFAVFVPNVRGSTGYGQKFMKMVDHDWGGKDRLDQVEGLKVLEKKEPRVDSSRRAVIGRSYGGYMTLTLTSRHPELWKAAVDMFGPYNLLTFIERLPESWRTSFYLAVGHPEKDKGFLEERSPSTYIDNVKCAMMMIQGKNDPRVVERETHDVVERLRSRGVPVEYVVFEDEGHDVLKFKNRLECYKRITQFFTAHLKADRA